MRRGAAHIKIANRSAIASPAGNGAEEEKLLEREFALKNISFGEAGGAFDIERRNDLATDNNFFEIGRELRNGVNDGVAEGFALVVPGAAGEFVRRVLHEAGHDVLAGGGDRWVGERGNDNVNVRAAG